eukprot:TRINITY_DN12330_c0_g1_i1.p3 TRINITY_DN12330_c0_g1~~TRINITY_DN12330_c0_g1_i1.p3  ORF type:complete len:128 (-),score=21.78 TRINITY_DN12330_c0_g1_i1:97-456(-)
MEALGMEALGMEALVSEARVLVAPVLAAQVMEGPGKAVPGSEVPELVEQGLVEHGLGGLALAEPMLEVRRWGPGSLRCPARQSPRPEGTGTPIRCSSCGRCPDTAAEERRLRTCSPSPE